jgi:predicted nucleic acid-binding protein
MRVLIDTDVVLDLLLQRADFFADAFAVWQAGDQRRYERFIAAITPINVAYIGRKLIGAAAARRAVGELLAATAVCAVDDAVLLDAYQSGMTDFEDAVQVAAARRSQIDLIVTRNTSHYREALLPALTPAAFLEYLSRSA